jgi:hypothetical protein
MLAGGGCDREVSAEDLRDDASRVLMTSIKRTPDPRPNTMTGFRGLERVHRGVEAALGASPPVEPNRTARGPTTTDRPREMQTQSIHIDSLAPGIFPKPVRGELDSADAERLTETTMVTGTTEPAPPAEVLAELARRALEEAWAADWGPPWMKAIWHAAAAEWRAARAQEQRRPARSP